MPALLKDGTSQTLSNFPQKSGECKCEASDECLDLLSLLEGGGAVRVPALLAHKPNPNLPNLDSFQATTSSTNHFTQIPKQLLGRIA